MNFINNLMIALFIFIILNYFIGSNIKTDKKLIIICIILFASFLIDHLFDNNQTYVNEEFVNTVNKLPRLKSIRKPRTKRTTIPVVTPTNDADLSTDVQSDTEPIVQPMVQQDTQQMVQQDAQQIVQDAQPMVQQDAQPMVQQDAQPMVQDTQQMVQDAQQMVQQYAQPDAQPMIQQDAQQDAQPMIQQDAQPMVQQDAQPMVQYVNQPEPVNKLPIERRHKRELIKNKISELNKKLQLLSKHKARKHKIISSEPVKQFTENKPERYETRGNSGMNESQSKPERYETRGNSGMNESQSKPERYETRGNSGMNELQSQIKQTQDQVSQLMQSYQSQKDLLTKLDIKMDLKKDIPVCPPCPGQEGQNSTQQIHDIIKQKTDSQSDTLKSELEKIRNEITAVKVSRENTQNDTLKNELEKLRTEVKNMSAPDSNNLTELKNLLNIHKEDINKMQVTDSQQSGNKMQVKMSVGDQDVKGSNYKNDLGEFKLQMHDEINDLKTLIKNQIQYGSDKVNTFTIPESANISKFYDSYGSYI